MSESASDTASDAVECEALDRPAGVSRAAAPKAREAVPAAEPIVGGVTGGLFGARGLVARDLGPWSEEIAGEKGEKAPEYNGWNGAPLLAEALCELAFGRVAPEDCALRLIAGAVDSPIARRLLPECAHLAERGARMSILLSAEPRKPESIAAIAALSRALGVPRLDDFLRVADFPGAELCVEQAMVGDRFYWSGEPLARRRPTPLAVGSLFDLKAAPDAPDAARLRFSAAWRLGGEPSAAFCRRVAAAARTL